VLCCLCWWHRRPPRTAQARSHCVLNEPHISACRFGVGLGTVFNIMASAVHLPAHLPALTQPASSACLPAQLPAQLPLPTNLPWQRLPCLHCSSAVMSAPAPHTSRACLLSPSHSAPQYHPLTLPSPSLPAPPAHLPASLPAGSPARGQRRAQRGPGLHQPKAEEVLRRRGLVKQHQQKQRQQRQQQSCGAATLAAAQRRLGGAAQGRAREAPTAAAAPAQHLVEE
jgi:hypothetical protein